jgi:predicted metal-dependent phosphoesterase TrpH
VRIDLHTHSTRSDGTDAPAGLVAHALAAGLDVVGLTDHDVMTGWDEAFEASRRLGVAVVPGVEISCERDGRSVHLLGYLLDPANPALLAELDRARSSRATRLQRMVDLLAADGIPISQEHVAAQVPAGATPGRPHVADALVASGVVADRDEAFRRWLADDSPYYVRYYAPDPARAVALVRAAGGVPVLAHPLAARRGVAPTLALVEELAAVGLAGVEADHPDHDERARRAVREAARHTGVFVTGSSDYHGTGKPVRIGAELTHPDVLAAIESLGAGSAVVRP